MASGTYTITVQATGEMDAIDIAIRRASDDGYRTTTAEEVHETPATGHWSVTLRVVAK